MIKYVIRRLLALVLVVIGVVTVVFLVVRAVPGDPVASILGEQALEVDKRALRQCLHLDEPLLEQYRLYWESVLDGTFGELCGERGATVWEKLRANIPATLQLAAAALAVAIAIAVPLGVAASLRPYSWVDNTSAVLALLGISIPNFWLGPMLLILFSLTLKALPNPGAGVTGLSALVLPAVTLGTALAAKLTRITRSSMLEVLNLDFIRTAKAKGATRSQVVFKHALRNALIPVVTILGLQFGALMTGAIIVEKIFARPGLGTLLLDGINQRNYRIVQGSVVFISMSYVVVNLLTDLLYAQVDPRIRYDQRRFPMGGWCLAVGTWLLAIDHTMLGAVLAASAGCVWAPIAWRDHLQWRRGLAELGVLASGIAVVLAAPESWGATVGVAALALAAGLAVGLAPVVLAAGALALGWTGSPILAALCAAAGASIAWVDYREPTDDPPTVEGG